MSENAPLSPKARWLLSGVVAVFALSVGWFGADLWGDWRAQEAAKEVFRRHAWSMAQLRPGHDYELAAFPAPADSVPPTFKVHINSRGIRERPFEDHAADGVTRIIAVGDSTSFGTGVAIGERFTEVLQRALDERSPGRFEVLNAGQAGMTAVTAARFLRETALSWGPDVIVFGAMTNDLRDPDDPNRRRVGQSQVESYEQSLRRVVSDCRANKIAVVFWANALADPAENDPLRPYRRRMAEVSRELEVPYVDLEAVYNQHPATAREQRRFLAERPWIAFWPEYKKLPLGRTALHMDFAHPNRFGHARLAEALLKVLPISPKPGEDRSSYRR